MALVGGNSRRFIERQRTSLPFTVRGFESPAKEWHEITRLTDVTRSGARFYLRHHIEDGQLLHLTFEMPKHLRCFDFSEKEYRIWSVVRFIATREPETGADDSPQFIVGAAFIGKEAPYDFLVDPTKRYELKLRPTRQGLWEARQRPRKEWF